MLPPGWKQTAIWPEGDNSKATLANNITKHGPSITWGEPSPPPPPRDSPPESWGHQSCNLILPQVSASIRKGGYPDLGAHDWQRTPQVSLLIMRSIVPHLKTLSGLIPGFPFNCMAFTPWLQRDFIKLDLGPRLEAAGFGPSKLKLMIMDDQRYLLPKWAEVVLSDPEAAKYVAGIAFHWYGNSLAPPIILDKTREKHPNTFLLATEATEGSTFFIPDHVIMGSWERGENYAHDILDDLLHWTSGWIDWNMALNTQGGPTWMNNFCDSPIIVNASAQEFYKQPMFYALGHFSKFLPPDSLRVGIRFERFDLFNRLEAGAFVDPNGSSVVFVMNRENHAVPLTVIDDVAGVQYSKELSPRSFNTFVHKP